MVHMQGRSGKYKCTIHFSGSTVEVKISLSRPAAINRHNLPRNITRPLRRQKQNRGGKLTGLANASHRRHCIVNTLVAFTEGLRHAREKQSWRDTVNAKIKRSTLYR